MRQKYITRFYRVDVLANLLVALFLAAGIALSGLASRLRTGLLFEFSSAWDPGVLTALGVCLLLNCVSFTLIRKKLYKSLRRGKLDKPAPVGVAAALKSALGATLMGVAWGIGDMGASSMLANLQLLTPHVTLVYLPALVLGQLAGFLLEWGAKQCRKESAAAERGAHKASSRPRPPR